MDTEYEVQPYEEFAIPGTALTVYHQGDEENYVHVDGDGTIRLSYGDTWQVQVAGKADLPASPADLLEHRNPGTPVHSGGHRWTFPNGQTAYAVPDTHTPLRWEFGVGEGVTEVQAGLTGEQVEVRLAEIAHQPRKD